MRHGRLTNALPMVYPFRRCLEATLTASNFTKFDKSTTRSPKNPELTIRSKGTLVLNGPARLLLGEPTTVELLYDEDQDLIGLKPSSPADPDAHRLRATGKGTFTISGAAFLKHFDIPFGDAVKREVKMVDEILVVDLKDPGRDATSNQRRERFDDLAQRLVAEVDKARQRKRSKDTQSSP